MARKTRAENEEAERTERETMRAARRATKKKADTNADLQDLATQDLAIMRGPHSAATAGFDDAAVRLEIEEEAEWEKKHTGAIDDKPPTKLAACLDWLMEKPRQPPPEWQTYRREEIQNYIQDMRGGPFSLMPKSFDTFLYKVQANRWMKYWGDRDNRGRRDGRGVCMWPDPPVGGGESYFGLWREDQPNGHGLFRWYDGDIYLGEWAIGKLQGYGIYQYGPDGQYARDRYEGAYFNGLRQGTGVYKFAPKGDIAGAVYLGEWMRGRMHGFGMLTYADGEWYMGQWKNDLKEGVGEYKWGWRAGEVAGDKYQGEFHQGYAHGVGRTMFADGGFHKGRYSLGKMNGFGRLRVADGWEYIGCWKDDELQGEVVCFYAFGTGQGKEVQLYEMGEYVSTRPYDPTRDWGEIESQGLSEAKNADKASEDAAMAVKSVNNYARRSKESQLLARDAAEEARYMTRAAIAYKFHLKAWYGVKHYIFSEE